MLTTDFAAWLARVQSHLGWTDEQAARVGHGLEVTVAAPAREDPHRHKRRVTPGNWREVFDDRLHRLFEESIGPDLEAAGYAW